MASDEVENRLQRRIAAHRHSLYLRSRARLICVEDSAGQSNRNPSHGMVGRVFVIPTLEQLAGQLISLDKSEIDRSSI